MTKQKKYYTVRKWKQIWVFDNRDDCKRSVQWFQWAEYKSFLSRVVAEEALKQSYKKIVKSKTTINILDTEIPFEKKSIAVDAACSGNPGVMEYRGVELEKSWKQIFIQKFEIWTNNIGEFLAIVHGLSYLKEEKLEKFAIYTDSKIAINRVLKKKSKTKLEKTEQSKNLFEIIKRAEQRLQNNKYKTKIIKRDTKNRWEIPADFGRK